MKDSIYSKDDIIRKVRGLIKLSQKAGTSPQAAAAAAKVTALMTQYNLQRSEVQETRATDFVKEEFQTDSSASWLRVLLGAVCHSHFCKLITYTQTKNNVTIGSTNHVIIGEPHNIEAVKLLYQYLQSTLRHLAASGYDMYKLEDLKRRQEYEGQVESKYRNRWLNSFFHGACATLSERLAALRREFEEGLYEGAEDPRQLPEPKVDRLKEALLNFKPELEVEHILQQLLTRCPEEYEIDSLSSILTDNHTSMAEINDLLTLLLSKPVSNDSKTLEERATRNHAMVVSKEAALNTAVDSFFPQLVSLEVLDRSGREGFAEGMRAGRKIPLRTQHQKDRELPPG